MIEGVRQAYYYPNKMGRIVLSAAEEILGQNGIRAVLNLASLSEFIDNYPPNNLDLAFPFEDLSSILSRIEDMYGQRAGRGLALRSGRACFKHGLREFGPLLGVTDLTFRMLPVSTKIRAGIGIFADTFNNFSDQRVHVVDEERRYLWQIERCPVCWERQANQPVCHLAVGLLQEALYWVSGGRTFNIEEKLCVARGDPTCTIAIDKQPIE
jgi:hypothetical protein